MKALPISKERAIRFRQNGFSYSEILDYVHVSQSTLSSWLHGIPLAAQQQEKLDSIRQRGLLRGARQRYTDRIKRTHATLLQARQEMPALSVQDLWLVGITFYWAEGSKEAASHPGSGVVFTNQDDRVVRVFLRFLMECCDVEKSRIYFEIYIHNDRRRDEASILRFWAQAVEFPAEAFKVYYKYNVLSGNRQNREKLYHGTVRVRVRSSSILLRRMQGWAEEMSRQFCGLV